MEMLAAGQKRTYKLKKSVAKQEKCNEDCASHKDIGWQLKHRDDNKQMWCLCIRACV